MSYRRRARSTQPYVPAKTDGQLYYVRLKTEFGIFYKLGFTSMDSVEARLAFKGTGDEKFIDEVLLFMYFEDAFKVEQRFHNHFKSAFGKFSSRGFMPLFGNGQSELYAKDILRLDPAFSEAQEQEVMLGLDAEYRKRGLILDPSKSGQIARAVGKALGIILLPVFLPIIWLVDRLNEPDLKESLEKHRRWEAQLAASMDTLIQHIHDRRHAESVETPERVRV